MTAGAESDKHDETLLVRCKACGVPFPAGLQVDRASLEAMVVSSTYSCPECGCDAVYVKGDHFPVLLTGD